MIRNATATFALALAATTTLVSAQVSLTISRSASSTSKFQLGISHTNPAIDLGGTYGVVQAAADRAKALLNGVPAINNVHLNAFGTDNPQHFQTSTNDWTSFDRRLTMTDGLGGDLCITLNSAPGWMQPRDATKDKLAADGSWVTDVSRGIVPTTSNYNAYAQLCVDALLHAQSGGRTVKYVQVWNEMKGFYNSSLSQFDGRDLPEYENMYNAVVRKIRGTPSLASIKIGGLYTTVSGSGAKTKYGYSGPATWDPLQDYVDGNGNQINHDRNTIKTFLTDSVAANTRPDFLCVDYGIVSTKDTNQWKTGDPAGPDKYSPDNRIQLAAKDYRDVITAVSQVEQSAGVSIPIWMSEYYGLQRYPNKTDAGQNGVINPDQYAHDYGSNRQEAALNALAYKGMIEAGATTALMWNGGQGESHHGLYTDIRDVDDFGRSTPGTGGKVITDLQNPSRDMQHLELFKNINEYFGAGRPIVSVISGDSTKVDALASTRMAMLINKTGNTQQTLVNGRSVTLTPYQVKMSTLLPSTFSFTADSDYDTNFKKGSTNNGIYRDASANRLRVASGGVGMAVLDMRASGGIGGTGGTGGLDTNNDLDDFSISGRVKTTAFSDLSQVGYLLRLNDSEAGGYLALASFDSAAGMRFRLYEGVALDAPIPATPIFDNNSTRANDPDLLLNTDYYFRVTANGNVFTFELFDANRNSLQLAQSFTDSTLTASNGQAGIRLRAGGTATYLDNLKLDLPSAMGGPLALQFAAVPEPTALAAAAGVVTLALRRRRVICA